MISKVHTGMLFFNSLTYLHNLVVETQYSYCCWLIAGAATSASVWWWQLTFTTPTSVVAQTKHSIGLR